MKAIVLLKELIHAEDSDHCINAVSNRDGFSSARPAFPGFSALY